MNIDAGLSSSASQTNSAGAPVTFGDFTFAPGNGGFAATKTSAWFWFGIGALALVGLALWVRFKH